jgi:hypothetical protein
MQIVRSGMSQLQVVRALLSLVNAYPSRVATPPVL